MTIAALNDLRNYFARVIKELHN